MVETITAMERIGKPNKLRREGFIPSVIYGKELAKPFAVMFETQKFAKLLKYHGRNARIKVSIGDNEETCIVKDIQFDVVTGEMLHADLQAVSADMSIKLRVPIRYSGRELLEANRYILQIFSAEIELTGVVKNMPEYLEVDVSDKQPGDKVIVSDLRLEEDIKTLVEPDEVLAIVTAPKEYSEDEEDTEDTEAAEVAEGTEDAESAD